MLRAVVPRRCRGRAAWVALTAGCVSVTLTMLAWPAQGQSSRRRRPQPATEQATPDPTPNPARAAKKTRGTTADEAADKTPASTEGPRAPSGGAAVSSLSAEEIADFDKQPAPVRQLLLAALELTGRNLTYTYGSADPAAGGMDCSGTIYYLLRAAGFGDVPRQANEQYLWVRRRAAFYAVLSRAADNVELKELRPGDLLFWTGTYQIDRDPPVTHAMIYLGRRKKDGKPLMFGASDGRPYDGQRRNGVSVFDFKLPAARSGDAADASTTAAPERAPNFVGYGPVPGLAERNDYFLRRAEAGAADEAPRRGGRGNAEAAATPTPTPARRRTDSRR